MFSLLFLRFIMHWDQRLFWRKRFVLVKGLFCLSQVSFTPGVFWWRSTSLWHRPLIITQSVTELAWLKKKIPLFFFLFFFFLHWWLSVKLCVCVVKVCRRWEVGVNLAVMTLTFTMGLKQVLHLSRTPLWAYTEAVAADKVIALIFYFSYFGADFFFQ